MNLRTHKVWKYMVGLFILIILAIVFYSFYMIDDNDKILLDIKQKIQQSEHVDFSKIVDGEWDNIILITPYTSKSEIKDKYGIDANRISDFSIEYREDLVLIIFCNEKSIQDYIYWHGNILITEKEKLYDSIKIKREDAKFKVDKISDNSEVLNLILLK